SEYPDWYQRYLPILNQTGRPNVDPVRWDSGFNAFVRAEAKNASVQAWYRESSRSTGEGSGEGGTTPGLYFVDEAKWHDRSLVVEGQHALELSDKLTLHSILTFNRFEIAPDSRYVFPSGGTGANALFLMDYKYGVGTGATLEEKFDYVFDDATRV